MNIYEILVANRSLMALLKKNGVNLNDIDNLKIYEEFLGMKSHNHKTVYCVAVLSEKYGRTQRAIYNIIKHFRQNVEL